MATITTSDMQRVVSLSKEDGREALRKCLEWQTFDEDLNMRQSIHLDLIYDSILFASEKGFTWDKVAVVSKFANEIIQQIQESDNITDILAFYSKSSEHLLTLLDERDFRVYTSFVFETILPHFKLYKYVFSKERAEQIPTLPCKVQPPFETKTLKETKPISVWDYEKQVEELEEKESERVMQRQLEKEKQLSEIQTISQEEKQKITQTEAPLDKESVSNIIKEVMKQFTMSTTIQLSHKIADMKEDLEFKLEKTSVPRPTGLGPPPRYAIQSVKASSSKTPKSPKPESRASGRNKKK